MNQRIKLCLYKEGREAVLRIRSLDSDEEIHVQRKMEFIVGKGGFRTVGYWVMWGIPCYLRGFIGGGSEKFDDKEKAIEFANYLAHELFNN